MHFFIISVLCFLTMTSSAVAAHYWEKASAEEIQKFIDEGNDVNLQDDKEDTILKYFWMNTDILKQLVSHGADVNLRNRDGRTALWYAVEEDKKDIVEFLLDNGARIDLRDNRGEKIVQCLPHHPEILEMMLRKNILNDREQKELMLKAQFSGDEKLIALLKEYGCPLNVRDKDGRTALMNSSASLETVQMLQRFGLDINAKDNKGKTVLMYHMNDENIAKWLIETGADIHARDNNGNAAIHLAKIQIVPLLLQNGADVNARGENGRTALLRAAVLGNMDEVKLLIDKGADVNLSDNQGFTPLHAATQYPEIIKILLEHGADPNLKTISKKTVLMIASERGHKETQELLLNYKANVGSTDDSGRNAVDYAVGKDNALLLTDKLSQNELNKSLLNWNNYIHKEDVSKIQQLIDNGADVNARDNKGNTPLLISIHPAPVEHMEVLLKNGANPNLQNNEGTTPLILHYNTNAAVRLLLSYGAKPDVSDNRGDTVLHRFVSYHDFDEVCLNADEDNPKKQEYAEIFDLLLKAGADVNALNNYGMSPVTSAVYCPFMLKKLIDHGADANYYNVRSRHTALMVATKSDGQKSGATSHYVKAPVESVEILLKAGADVNVRNKKGETALDMATNPQKRELLLRYGAKHGADL